MRKRGFTLIELLVVVSIITLLISILLPSLSRARQQAKQVNCMSNMRNLSVAVQAYANDHREYLITAGLAHGGSVDEHAAWINSLRPYFGEKAEIARCPSDESEFWDQPYGDTETYRRTSYGSNYYTVSRIGNRGPYNRLHLIRRPAGTILMGELAEKGPYAVSDHMHPETWWPDPRRLASEQMAVDRHQHRANYNFVDGHAEVHRFENTYSIDEEQSEFPNIVWKRNLYDPLIAR